jgi:hypothetical protein
MLQHLHEQVLDTATRRPRGNERAHIHPTVPGKVGMTPGEWTAAQRIDHDRQLLETTDLPIPHVADRAGFPTASSLRHHFRSALGPHRRLTAADFRRVRTELCDTAITSPSHLRSGVRVPRSPAYRSGCRRSGLVSWDSLRTQCGAKP